METTSIKTGCDFHENSFCVGNTNHDRDLYFWSKHNKFISYSRNFQMLSGLISEWVMCDWWLYLTSIFLTFDLIKLQRLRRVCTGPRPCLVMVDLLWCERLPFTPHSLLSLALSNIRELSTLSGVFEAVIRSKVKKIVPDTVSHITHSLMKDKVPSEKILR